MPFILLYFVQFFAWRISLNARELKTDDIFAIKFFDYDTYDEAEIMTKYRREDALIELIHKKIFSDQVFLVFWIFPRRVYFVTPKIEETHFYELFYYDDCDNSEIMTK